MDYIRIHVIILALLGGWGMKTLKKRNRKIIIGVCIAVIACVVIGIAIDTAIISGRTTFDSESEMIAYLSGEWNFNKTNLTTAYTFTDTNVSFEAISSLVNLGCLNEDYSANEITYNYRRGYVQVGSTELILIGSTLVEGDYVYEKVQ